MSQQEPPAMEAEVLLVEGEESIRKPLRELIVQTGRGCRPVACLRAGLHELRTQRYRFVIVDLDLPGVRGAECSRRLRSACPGACLVGLESTPEGEEVAPGARGFDVVIPKPFIFDALVELLNGSAPHGGRACG